MDTQRCQNHATVRFLVPLLARVQSGFGGSNVITIFAIGLYHVEARPVGASEFRRVYSETRRLSVCRLSARVGRRRAAARQSRNRAVCAAIV